MKIRIWIFALVVVFCAATFAAATNYVVTSDVVFVRKEADKRLPLEDQTAKQLAGKSTEDFPPYLYYGANVEGTVDPAHPQVVAVRFKMYDQDVAGYVDAKKVWAEPALAGAESPRYLCVLDRVNARLLPQPQSRVVLELRKGEVVDTLGQLTVNGATWIKAQFNSNYESSDGSEYASEPLRYGYLAASDVHSLLPDKVDQSSVPPDEMPGGIRGLPMQFSKQQLATLSRNGFYVEPIPPLKYATNDEMAMYNMADDMADQYKKDNPVKTIFVTTDLYLHTFHLLFDRMEQDVEEHKILPAVASMSAKLAKQAESDWKPAAEPGVQEALLYDLLYFSVAARLFDPGFHAAAPVSEDVNRLVDRIEKAEGEMPSLINKIKLGDEDFTQYRVRGHYATSEDLKRYFRGMMWFGRRPFLLKDDSKTLAAILVPHLIEASGQSQAYADLDTVLSFLIGAEDNYSVQGYRDVNQKVFGKPAPSTADISQAIDSRLADFRKNVAEMLPQQKIVSVQTGVGKTPQERLSETASFKFLGQRYTPDAFIFSNLTSPSVGTDANPRNLPSALDAMMVLGSTAAKKEQMAAQQKHQWANYEKQAEQLNSKSLLDAPPPTFYRNWLGTLATLFAPVQSKQLFAIHEPWQYKSLNAALGSWTELKHDTVLYAKQSEAEMGAEGDEFVLPAYAPPDPKGYVEPNPALFGRIADLTQQFVKQMQKANLLTDEYIDKFQTFATLTTKAQEIAQKEVSNAPVNAADYQWIREMPMSFDRALLLPRDSFGEIDPDEIRMALITDVATDAVAGRVLEVAIGVPQRIVVVAKDAFGGTRLTIGYVYSWYEFPSNKRWTDQEWKKLVLGPKTGLAAAGVKLPDWYTNFQ